jgi:hypothetical protein
MLNFNKKGQTGETISWIIATIVIIGILILFIYLSTLLAKVKTIDVGNLRTDLSKNSLVLAEKTSIAHQLAGDKNKEVIDQIISEYDDK